MLRSFICCTSGRSFTVVLFGLFSTLNPLSSATAEDYPQSQNLTTTDAATLLPYARLACDAYSVCKQGDLANTGFRKDDLTWQDAFRRSGAGEGVISMYERAGFSATIFQNDRTKEIVVSIRGTDEPIPNPLQPFGTRALRNPGDWEANIDALSLKTANERLIAQYVAGRSLAARLNQIYANTPYSAYSHTLTGHSLGAAIASYAGQHVEARVITFDAARNALSTTGISSRQINVITTGDPVSDPIAKIAGVKIGGLTGTPQLLPGQTIRLNLPATLNPAGKHDINTLVADIGSVASGRGELRSPATKLPTSTWTPSTTPPAAPLVTPNKAPSSNYGRVANTSPAAPGISSDRAPPTQSLSAVSRGTYATPGGISLSRAAADRMPLEIALDASALSDGKIVLSGRASKTRMDAALFLTALRAACDDRDPYFSLDPDDGTLWGQQGDQASNEFWEKIKKDFASDAPARGQNAQVGINIRTVSATRDYPGIWHDISPHYPNFRAKLVFYPEWLRQTRLGEVLYKADVLLKELSSGVSILVPGKLRASAIPGYLSADVEYATKSLLDATRDQAVARPQWRGSRLWFEITPSKLPTNIMNEATAPSSSGDPALRSLLQSKGLIRSADQLVHHASFFMRHGNVFDLSQVNPIMFVRVHDHATNKDLSDHDPRLDGLAADVSTRFDQYAKQYDELGLLREVFRAYIAARKITEANDRLCGSLDAMPLLDSEKLAARLPDYHPSELFVTIASYSTVSRKGRQTQFVKASSMSGGVSIAGQKFAETAMRDGETTVTRAVEAALAGVNLDQPDAIDSDRKFISFIVDDGSGTAVRLASNARDLLAPRSLSDYPIENEPQARANPFTRASSQRNDTLIETLAAILIIGLLFSYLVRKRREARG